MIQYALFIVKQDRNIRKIFYIRSHESIIILIIARNVNQLIDIL